MTWDTNCSCIDGKDVCVGWRLVHDQHQDRTVTACVGNGEGPPRRLPCQNPHSLSAPGDLALIHAAFC